MFRGHSQGASKDAYAQAATSPPHDTVPSKRPNSMLPLKQPHLDSMTRFHPEGPTRPLREGAFAPGWADMYIESLSYGVHFPFSPFVNDLLIAINRAPGQARPIGWLTITIFIVGYRIAKIELTLPLFFNMHNTSHSGPLTSFSSAKDCKIFVKWKPDKVAEGRCHKKWCYVRGGMSEETPKVWTSLAKANHEVLAAANSSVEPKQIPFSMMFGKWVPLFKRAKVVKKSSQGSAPSLVPSSSPPFSKPVITEASSFVLGKRDPPFPWLQGKMHLRRHPWLTFQKGPSSFPEEESDSARKAKAG
ncbi:hypothetical protein LIER_29506 [Lithospermum erythrorhizon]|uniref:Uncharacterized protein n=1 Tax=Lithospermum erythrorhizon TaxID=34254 RepID=A0AAV3RQB7_LITER